MAEQDRTALARPVLPPRPTRANTPPSSETRSAMQDNKNFFLAIALSMSCSSDGTCSSACPRPKSSARKRRFRVSLTRGSPPRAGARHRSDGPEHHRHSRPHPARRARRDPRERARRVRARDHRQPARARLDRAEGRRHRRHRAEGLSRDGGPQSPNIVVFSPANGPDGYFARFGWLPAAGAAAGDVPSPQTVWTADQRTLTEKTPVTLSWDNGKGLALQAHDLHRRQLHAHGRRQRGEQGHRPPRT